MVEKKILTNKQSSIILDRINSGYNMKKRFTIEKKKNEKRGEDGRAAEMRQRI
jgi:hypothetical protein